MFPYGLGYLLYNRNRCSVANPHFHLRINNRCTPVGQDSLYRLRACTTSERPKRIAQFRIKMITTGVNSFNGADIKPKIIRYLLHSAGCV